MNRERTLGRLHAGVAKVVGCVRVLLLSGLEEQVHSIQEAFDRRWSQC